MPGEELGPDEEIGSGGGSCDDDAGADDLASRWLFLFFLCCFAGVPASCVALPASSGTGGTIELTSRGHWLISRLWLWLSWL